MKAGTQRKTMLRANEEQTREFWEWINGVGGMSIAARIIGVSYQSIYLLADKHRPPTVRMFNAYKKAASTAQ